MPRPTPSLSPLLLAAIALSLLALSCSSHRRSPEPAATAPEPEPESAALEPTAAPARSPFDAVLVLDDQTVFMLGDRILALEELLAADGSEPGTLHSAGEEGWIVGIDATARRLTVQSARTFYLAEAGPEQLDLLPNRFALLPRTAEFRLGRGPEHDGARFSADLESAGRRSHVLLHLAEQGDWTYVANPDPPNRWAGHCNHTWQGLRGALFFGWVRSADLLPVVHEELSLEHPDGSSVRLHPGLGLFVDEAAPPADDGTRLYLAEARPWSLPIKLQPDSLQAWYLPSEPFGRPSYSMVLDEDTTLTLNGLPVANAWAERGVAYVEEEIPKGEHSLYVVTERCFEARLLAPRARAEENETADSVGGINFSQVPAVPPNTRLYRADGRRIGITTDTLLFPYEGPQHPDLRCFDVPLDDPGKKSTTAAEPHNLTLCVDPRDLSTGRMESYFY